MNVPDDFIDKLAEVAVNFEKMSAYIDEQRERYEKQISDLKGIIGPLVEFVGELNDRILKLEAKNGGH